MDEALVDSHCVVRLVTAVEAVRRKEKAAVRLWVALSEEDCIGLFCLWWEADELAYSKSLRIPWRDFRETCVFATHNLPQNHPRLRIIRFLRFLYTH